MCFGGTSDIGFLGVSRSRRRDADCLQLDARRDRIADQMNAVQQQPRSGRIGCTCEVTECADDGVVATGDGFHLVGGSWLAVGGQL